MKTKTLGNSLEKFHNKEGSKKWDMARENMKSRKGWEIFI